jgi:hypothetical protein
MRRLAPLLALVLLGLATPDPASADCALRTDEPDGTTQASVIKILGADDDGDFCQSCIDSAITTWDDACSGYENPTFVGASGSAAFSAFVRFVSGTNPGTFEDCSSSKCACAFVNYDPQNGTIVGGTIRVWQKASGTANCSAQATELLTHEFTHLLGVEDPPAGCDCTNIMGDVEGAIDGQVCQTIDQVYQTLNETPDPDPEHPCQNPPV